jgi:chaperonin cofactor prefoldin
MSSLFELYSIQRELASVERSLSNVETQIAELKEALKWAKELHPVAVYRNFSRVSIAVDPEKAEELIKKEIERLEKVKELLERRRRELLERAKQLQ